MGGVWKRIICLTKNILDSMLLNHKAQKLTHDILCTFMCEVSAIINSRPIAPISYDPEKPEIITPYMLLTQKTEPLPALINSTDVREMYKEQWKFVQILSNTFWKRWQDSYLHTLQRRRKWSRELPDVQVGNVVLLRDLEQHSNNWPLGIVVSVFPSDIDSKVRSVEIQTTKNGKKVTYVRPVTELVLLVNTV